MYNTKKHKSRPDRTRTSRADSIKSNIKCDFYGLHSKIKTLEKQFSNVKNENNYIKKDNSKLREQVKSLQTKIQEKSKSISQNKEDYNTKILELEKNSKKLKDELVRFKSNTKNLINQLESKDFTINKLRNKSQLFSKSSIQFTTIPSKSNVNLQVQENSLDIFRKELDSIKELIEQEQVKNKQYQSVISSLQKNIKQKDKKFTI